MPNYTGNPYDLSEEAKKRAVLLELNRMSKPMTDCELRERYGQLYDAVCQLPGKITVDVDAVLRIYVGRYIYELQAAVSKNPTWTIQEVQRHLAAIQPYTKGVFEVQHFTRRAKTEFDATVSIVNVFSGNLALVRVNHQTNAGMGAFRIEQAAGEELE